MSETDWTALYTLWQIAVGIIAVAAAGIAVHTRRNAAEARLAERVALLEAKLEETPTSKAMHELALSISGVSGELKANTARLEGLGEIVKRLDRITDRQERYLLERGGGS